MTSSYNALSGIVTAANDALSAVRSHDENAAERIRQIWEPVANALLDAEPDFAEWPELAKQAEECGGDYVGVTSDTRQVVCWGEELANGARLFTVLDRA